MLAPFREGIRKWGKSTGHDWDLVEMGSSTAAAALVLSSFELGTPFPLPPRVHVAPPLSGTGRLPGISSSQDFVMIMSAAMHEWGKFTGQEWDLAELGSSTAAAALVLFSCELGTPFPLPPRVQAHITTLTEAADRALTACGRVQLLGLPCWRLSALFALLGTPCLTGSRRASPP